MTERNHCIEDPINCANFLITTTSWEDWIGFGWLIGQIGIRMIEVM